MASAGPEWLGLFFYFYCFFFLVAFAITKLVCRFHLGQGCTRKLTKPKIALKMTSAGLDHAASGFQANSSIPEISPIRSTDQNNNLIKQFTPLFFRILTRFRSYWLLPAPSQTASTWKGCMRSRYTWACTNRSPNRRENWIILLKIKNDCLGLQLSSQSHKGPP